MSRLRHLREAIEREAPTDGIHNPDVAELATAGGACPRYFGCTSEGSAESTYRDNPDFFAGKRDEAAWLAGSYGDGWCGNWILDLDTGENVDWTVRVEVTA